MCLRFNTPDGRADLSLPDPNKTPILIPIYIIAPYFKYNSQPGSKSFRSRQDQPISEDDTIESVLENPFSSVVIDEMNMSWATRRDLARSALAHDSVEDSIVYVPTFRGPFFIVPCKATFKKIIAGASWHRNGP